MENHVWTYDDIVKALRLKGYPLSRISTELGLSYAATRYGVRHGSIESLRYLVSTTLGVPEWALWSARFPRQWRISGPPPEAK